MIIRFKIKNSIIFILVIIIYLLFFSPKNPTPPPYKFNTFKKVCAYYAAMCNIRSKNFCDNYQVARLNKVIDGDTIEVTIKDKIYKVRYIGIDTPEIDKKQCFAKPAKDFNMILLDKSTIYLIKDVRETDKYGRLLRYVFTDRYFVNLELVRFGYAKTLTIPPDITFSSCFLRYQKNAQDKRLNIWSDKCRR